MLLVRIFEIRVYMPLCLGLFMGTGLAAFYGHKIRELSAFLEYRILSSLLSLELFTCRVAIQSLFVRPLYGGLRRRTIKERKRVLNHSE